MDDGSKSPKGPEADFSVVPTRRVSSELANRIAALQKKRPVERLGVPGRSEDPAGYEWDFIEQGPRRRHVAAAREEIGQVVGAVLKRQLAAMPVATKPLGPARPEPVGVPAGLQQPREGQVGDLKTRIEGVLNRALEQAPRPHAASIAAAGDGVGTRSRAPRTVISAR